MKIILSALSYYNLGHSQSEAANMLSKRFKLKPSQKAISNWISEYKEICAFSKLRSKAIKLFKPEDIINKQILNHIQPYTFKYHKAKLHLLFHSIRYNNQFHNISHFYEPLKSYLQKIPTENFPHHIFKSYDTKIKEGLIKQQIKSPESEIAKINNNAMDEVANEQRASQLRFRHLEIRKIQKSNLTSVLAQLALQTASSNKDRHNAIQNFMLFNDSTTIAVEVPVYLTNDDILYLKRKKFILNLEDYATPITGHIDILQIRNGLIHILDYKPEADKISPIEQLTIYALALASRTKLALKDFKCAWFNESNYFEFFPLHAVYEKK